MTALDYGEFRRQPTVLLRAINKTTREEDDNALMVTLEFSKSFGNWIVDRWLKIKAFLIFDVNANVPIWVLN